MPHYRLRTATITPEKTVGATVLDFNVKGEDDEAAILRAKEYPLFHFLDEADFAWLTDPAGKTIWSVKIKQMRE